MDWGNGKMKSTRRAILAAVLGAVTAIAIPIVFRAFKGPMDNRVFNAYFIGWCVGAILTFPLDRKMLRILETRHREKWVEMGSPSLVMNNSIKNTIATIRFLIKGEYEMLGDEEFSVLCRRLVLLNAYFLSFIAFMLLFILPLVMSGHLS